METSLLHIPLEGWKFRVNILLHTAVSRRVRYLFNSEVFVCFSKIEITYHVAYFLFCRILLSLTSGIYSSENSSLHMENKIYARSMRAARGSLLRKDRDVMSSYSLVKFDDRLFFFAVVII